MKKMLAVMVPTFVSICLGQYLETTLWLPDSLGGLDGITNVLFCPLDSTVWTAGKDVTVVDPVSVSKLQVVARDADVYAMLYNHLEGKVYFTDLFADSLSVVDARTRTVVARVPVGDSPSSLAFDSVGNKVYCGNEQSDEVFVVDCSTDTVVARVDVGSFPVGLMFDPLDMKVFCSNASGHSVSVIDALEDSVIATIELSGRTCSLAFNPDARRVYCKAGSTVAVIDARGDSLICEVDMGSGARDMYYHAGLNKLYCSAFGELVVIDCNDDSVTVRLPMWVGRLVCYPAEDRLYCGGDTRVYVVDCLADSVVARISAPGRDMEFRGGVYVPTVVRVFFGADWGRLDGLAAFDCPTDSLVKVLDSETEPFVVKCDPTTNTLYCLCEYNSNVYIFDAATNQALGVWQTGVVPADLAVNARHQKLYVAQEYEDGLIWVYSTPSGRVVNQLRTERHYPYRLLYNEVSDRLFCFAEDNHLYVYDGATDSLVAEDSGTGDPWTVTMNAGENKLYFKGAGLVQARDGTTGQLVGSVAVPRGEAYVACNTRDNKVYCGGYYESVVYVIDGSADTLMGQVSVAGQHPAGLAYDNRNNQVFCSTSDSASLNVIDCETDSLVAVLSTGTRPYDLLYQGIGDRVYVANLDDESITVVDAGGLVVLGTIGVRSMPISMAWCPSVSRLFVADNRASSISVIRDTTTGMNEHPGKTEPVLLWATMVRWTLSVTRSSDAVLLDIAGRKVMDLQPGENDIRHLAPGVYFVHEPTADSRQLAAVRKVVIQW
jgi:YVTN family beta-propeller protein